MQACVAARIAKGEIVHVDASLIRADVAWESLAERHVEAVAEANGDGSADAEKVRRRSKKTGKKVCLTDPDATMATRSRNRRLEPSYKQHGVVDDLSGVILDVEVTTGEVNEGQEILDRLDAAAARRGLSQQEPGQVRAVLGLGPYLLRAQQDEAADRHRGHRLEVRERDR